MGGRKVECKEMGKEHYSHTGKDPVSGRHGTEMFVTYVQVSSAHAITHETVCTHSSKL